MINNLRRPVLCDKQLITDSPAPLPDPSLTGGGGLLLPCWEGVGEAGGGGGAGPLVGVWPPGEGAVLLLLSEL